MSENPVDKGNYMCYTVNELDARSNDSYKDNLNVVFVIDTRIASDKLEETKKKILDISRTVLKNSPDSRIYIFEQNTDMSTDKGYKVYSAKGNRFFTDYNTLAEILKEVASSGTTKNSAILSDAVGGIISVCDLSRETYVFSFFSQDGVIYRTENGYAFLDSAVEKNVDISVIAEIDDSLFSGYAHDMYKRSGGIILTDTEDYTEAVLEHIYGKKINVVKDTGEYHMILATGLRKVELKEKVTNIYKLHKDLEKEQPNTDDDELPDYDEINFESELIKFTDDIVELPTYGECIDYKSGLTYVKQGLYRFDGQVATGIDFINYVRNNVRALPISSDPTNADGDHDGLNDDEEYYYEANPLDSDTDNDKLSDGFEVELWFDPINDNADGDSFSDYEEWINNTSPVVYNMTFQEARKEFLEGALLGDWVSADSIEKLLGQIAFSFVPFVADARDYFANIFVNLDSWAALANLGGFILDLTPAGAAGDAAKALSKLEKFVVKHADDVPNLLLFVKPF